MQIVVWFNTKGSRGISNEHMLMINIILYFSFVRECGECCASALINMVHTGHNHEVYNFFVIALRSNGNSWNMGNLLIDWIVILIWNINIFSNITPWYNFTWCNWSFQLMIIIEHQTFQTTCDIRSDLYNFLRVTLASNKYFPIFSSLNWAIATNAQIFMAYMIYYIRARQHYKYSISPEAHLYHCHIVQA